MAYSVDNWILAQPANHRIQKALLIDYYDNPAVREMAGLYAQIPAPSTRRLGQERPDFSAGER